MDIMTTYKVKIKHYNNIFKDTLQIYRNVVDYLLNVCDVNWENISQIGNSKKQMMYIENLIHATKSNPDPIYKDFDLKFYKLPACIRRSAINKAKGMFSIYKSNLFNWEQNPIGKKPSLPKAGFSFPVLYHDGAYEQIDTYKVKIKVFTRNTWDWLIVDLRKSDIDYINRHCNNRKECCPTLLKKDKEWFLAFPFEEKIELTNKPIKEQTIVAVDLGINTAATISVMYSDGTILGRHFCKLPKEIDSLYHHLNRIKKLQQHGSYKNRKLWARVKGINHDISSKTVKYIIDIATRYNADVIVFEHLDKKGKLKGSKKQKLKMWRSQEVQAIVTNKAHRLGMRISRVCAWNTSKLAYDGSGEVLRGEEAGFTTYSLCKFQTGKIYNCDLSASYNIGARYFIREILKSLDVNSRLDIETKLPQCSKRSTCTFSTLINLNAVI